MSQADHTPEKDRNNAFYATLAISLVTLLFVHLGTGRLTLLALIEIILFPFLGFLVKKSSKFAAKTLLFLFLIDTIFWTINWLLRTTSILLVYSALLIRFFLGWIFYRANLSVKTKK